MSKDPKGHAVEPQPWGKIPALVFVVLGFVVLGFVSLILLVGLIALGGFGTGPFSLKSPDTVKITRLPSKTFARIFPEEEGWKLFAFRYEVDGNGTIELRLREGESGAVTRRYDLGGMWSRDRERWGSTVVLGIRKYGSARERGLLIRKIQVVDIKFVTAPFKLNNKKVFAGESKLSPLPLKEPIALSMTAYPEDALEFGVDQPKVLAVWTTRPEGEQAGVVWKAGESPTFPASQPRSGSTSRASWQLSFTLKKYEPKGS